MRIANLSLLLALCFLLLGASCGGGTGGGVASNSNLSHIPEFAIQLSGPSEITNGGNGTYRVTVAYRQVNDPTDPPSITDRLELYGSTSTLPPFNGPLAAANLPPIAIGASAPHEFILSCQPQGSSGTLGSSGHGGRVCKTNPAVPCPPGCASAPGGCPKGCGAPIVTCVDDAVTLRATFHGAESNPLKVLCMPSTGPTRGTF